MGAKWHAFTDGTEVELGFPLIPALACLPSSVFNVPHLLDLGGTRSSQLLSTSAVGLNPEGSSDCGVSFASPWSSVLFYQDRVVSSSFPAVEVVLLVEVTTTWDR